MPSQFRLSVRLSVTRVDQSKTVEVMIMQFSPYSRPALYFLQDKFYPEILTGSPRAGTSKKGRWEKVYVDEVLFTPS